MLRKEISRANLVSIDFGVFFFFALHVRHVLYIYIIYSWWDCSIYILSYHLTICRMMNYQILPFIIAGVPTDMAKAKKRSS